MSTRHRLLAGIVAAVAVNAFPAAEAEPTSDKPAEIIRLPATVDLRPLINRLGLTPRSQGNRPTCSVFATTWALEFAVSKQLGKDVPLSVEYLNWASNTVLDRAEDGGFFHDLLSGFQRYGICREEDMPYADQFNPQLSPSPEARARAKRIGTWATVGLKLHWINPWQPEAGLTDVQIGQIKATLAKGWPVAAGSSHSRLLVGYRDDPRQAGGGVFVTKDSGTGTYSEVTYEFAKTKIGDVFWIESRPEWANEER